MADQLLAEIQALIDRVRDEIGIPRDADIERFDTVVAVAEFAFREYASQPAFTSLGPRSLHLPAWAVP